MPQPALLLPPTLRRPHLRLSAPERALATCTGPIPQRRGRRPALLVQVAPSLLLRDGRWAHGGVIAVQRALAAARALLGAAEFVEQVGPADGRGVVAGLETVRPLEGAARRWADGGCAGVGTDEAENVRFGVGSFGQGFGETYVRELAAPDRELLPLPLPLLLLTPATCR